MEILSVYQERLHRGALKAGDLLNVPVALLDAGWAASQRMSTLAVLVGTVLGVRFEGTRSSVLVRVETYGPVCG